MFDRYNLILTITRNCNMRCSYCYGGQKINQVMPEPMARKAIDRAIASIAPGGKLDLGFFGGEPLMQAGLIERLIDYARSRTTAAGLQLAFSMTTNGTIAHPRAWSIMTQPDMHLAISCDGLPSVHDRHRRFDNGEGTAKRVLDTIRRLLATGVRFRVVMVVRPDTLDSLPDSIESLQNIGVRRIEPSLDVWAQWGQADIAQLERIVVRCAEIWRKGLPYYAISWFEEKLVQLAKLPRKSARCGFGRGELTVTPTGRMYPCERLVGDDLPNSPMTLGGHVMEGNDFLSVVEAPARSEHACNECAMAAMCNTFCRCSNYVRTGDVSKPDGLLCAWNQACLNETARIMHEDFIIRSVTQNTKEECHECTAV